MGHGVPPARGARAGPPRPGARGGTRAHRAAPITIHHGRGAQLSWPTNHEIVIHWIDTPHFIYTGVLSSIQLVRPRPPQSGAPLARCGVAAATTRTDVGPGEQARAGLANSGTWSGSSDTQLRRPACAALTSGGLIGGGPRIPARVQKAVGAAEELANEEMAPRSLRLHAAHALRPFSVVVAHHVAHEGRAAQAAAGCRHLGEAIQVNHMQRLKRLAFTAAAATELL